MKKSLAMDIGASPGRLILGSVRPGDALVAGFGADFGTSAATVHLTADFAGKRI